jgi:hypothetical protein
MEQLLCAGERIHIFLVFIVFEYPLYMTEMKFTVPTVKVDIKSLW